jgi:hypothetical protein
LSNWNKFVFNLSKFLRLSRHLFNEFSSTHFQFMWKILKMLQLTKRLPLSHKLQHAVHSLHQLEHELQLFVSPLWFSITFCNKISFTHFPATFKLIYLINICSHRTHMTAFVSCLWSVGFSVFLSAIFHTSFISSF